MLRALCLFLLLPACGGPRLKSKTVATKSYTSTVQCSQTPVEATFTAKGSKYGEVIEISACSPRGLRVRASVSTGGEFFDWGEIGTSSDSADNSRCLAGREVVLASGTKAGDASSGGGEGGSESTAQASAHAKSQRRDFRESDFSGQLCFGSPTTALHLGVLDKGSEIKVKLWSLEPNDMEGALIQIRHVTLWPNVSEKEWAKHVAKREKKRAHEEVSIDEETEEDRRALPQTPPPPAKMELPPPRLSVDAQWRPGYWHWTQGQWIWVAGSWRERQASATILPPPPARSESISPRPGAHFVWMPGHWSFDGSVFMWVAGLWIESR